MRSPWRKGSYGSRSCAWPALSVYRGHNPRDFALFAFGGAGPLVASELATELGMNEVVVPPYPGNLSALGLLVSPLKRDFVRTRLARLTELSAGELEAGFAELESRARTEFAQETAALHALRLHRTLDLRYVGQSFTLNVALAPGAPADPPEIERSFHAVHESNFGHAAPGEPAELVNIRLAASLPRASFSLRAPTAYGGKDDAPPRRRVFFAGRHVECPVYERARLGLGTRLEGPAVVQEPGSSTIVRPSDRLRVDPQGNLRIEVACK
jgi:N-methylhydantoinase A